MQSILGAGGPVGIELAKALRSYTSQVRLVSRHPEKVSAEDELFAADLLKAEEVDAAVSGSEVVYLTAGLEYSHKAWQRDWPVIVQNVTDACLRHDAKLVFFDNVYLYDKSCIPKMDENSTVSPPSKKGLVRARIAENIMQQVWTESLTALIARSADFYGPNIKSGSLLIETVFKPLSKSKKATWLGSAEKQHSFTYVPDAAKATALLGNSEEAYGQVWHLPTAKNPPTGKEWVEMVAKEMGVKAGYQEVPKWLVRVMGLGMPIMRETVEMMYQYEDDYIFDSSKFEEHFDFKPTSYKQGVKEVVTRDFRKN